MNTAVKYPEVEVALVGEDGNAFAILGRVSRALRKHLHEEGFEHAEAQALVNTYVEEATAGDYDNLLRVTVAWVKCCLLLLRLVY